MCSSDLDASEALKLPGVEAVWTAQDIADIGPIDYREGKIEKLEPYRQPVLAQDFVRYVGEPVAAVFARDAYVAEDAADLVALDIEELDPITDAEQPVTNVIDIGPGYFETMGIPVVRGREFTARDATLDPKTIIINEAMARRDFPGDDPIGHHFSFGPDEQGRQEWVEIIGVVLIGASVYRRG